LQNNIKHFLFAILVLIFCLSAGPYIIIENYGNWKTLSFASKSAYITGLWDGYMVLIGDDIFEEYNTHCSEGVVIRISDLVEVVDRLYEQEVNRRFSPSILLKDNGLKNICAN
jgi:hypothetical protein